MNRQNKGIEIAACRMNLLDMRGLLPQKVGKKQWLHERRDHWRTQISVNGTDALHLMLILSIFSFFLIVRSLERYVDVFSLMVVHKNEWRDFDERFWHKRNITIVSNWSN